MDLAMTRGSFAVVLCNAIGSAIPDSPGGLRYIVRADLRDGKRELDDDTEAAVA
jgi:hypothetical protein